MIRFSRLRYLLRRATDWLFAPWHAWRTRRLAARALGWRRPRHVGLILDGNRRFARGAGLARIIEGHARGAAKVRELLRWCAAYDIPLVTIWIFSTDNFKRSTEEVDSLLALIEDKTREIASDPEVHDGGLRLRYIGRRETLPPSLQNAIAKAEAATAHLTTRQLNVAIAYGGREEVVDAVRDYLRTHPDAPPEAFDEAALEAHLYTAGQPDVDMLIRTSGELRMSGFMIWQAAYAEYWFCPRFWPEFRRLDFLRALRDYHRRQRRLGK